MTSAGPGVAEIRETDLSRDGDAVARLWLDYLVWGNDGLESRYGFRLPVQEAVARDLGSIAKFQPPDGRLVLAFEDGVAVATAAMQRIGPETAEIKRMWVDPSRRRAGTGRAMLDHLIAAARTVGYRRIRLDSPDFMTPDRYKSHWVFMERALP